MVVASSHRELALKKVMLRKKRVLVHKSYRKAAHAHLRRFAYRHAFVHARFWYRLGSSLVLSFGLFFLPTVYASMGLLFLLIGALGLYISESLL